MDITLNDKDMERLAAILLPKLEERLLRDAVCDAARQELEARAVGMAKNIFGQINFTANAVEAMDRHLKADGEKLLRRIVADAVRQVRADDPELAKTVRRAIYAEAGDAAEQARRLLNPEGY